MDDRAGAIVDEPLDEHVTGLHELRKAAKRAGTRRSRWCPLFGADASRAAARAEALQDVLGEHQDSVHSQDALRRLGVSAHLSGENGFTFGVLLGGERQRAAAADADHHEVYRRTTTKKVRGWLEGLSRRAAARSNVEREEIWRSVERQRLALAHLLEELTPEQWETESLCSGWRVREVAAHATVPARFATSRRSSHW